MINLYVFSDIGLPIPMHFQLPSARPFLFLSADCFLLNLSDQCSETERVWLARPVTLGLFCRELEACSKVADTTKDSSEQPALASCHGQVSVSVCKKIEFTIQLLPYYCLKTFTYISDVSSKKYADHPCINDIGMLQLTDCLTVSRRKSSINCV